MMIYKEILYSFEKCRDFTFIRLKNAIIFVRCLAFALSYE